MKSTSILAHTRDWRFRPTRKTATAGYLAASFWENATATRVGAVRRCNLQARAGITLTYCLTEAKQSSVRQDYPHWRVNDRSEMVKGVVEHIPINTLFNASSAETLRVIKRIVVNILPHCVLWTCPLWRLLHLLLLRSICVCRCIGCGLACCRRASSSAIR